MPLPPPVTKTILPAWRSLSNDSRDGRSSFEKTFFWVRGSSSLRARRDVKIGRLSDGSNVGRNGEEESSRSIAQRSVTVAADAAHQRLLRDVLAIARIPAPTFSESARMDWIERRLDSAPGTLHRDDV